MLPIFYRIGSAIFFLSLVLMLYSATLMIFTTVKPEEITLLAIIFISGGILVPPSLQLATFAFDPKKYLGYGGKLDFIAGSILWIIFCYYFPKIINNFLQQMGKEMGQKIPDIFSDNFYWIYMTSVFLSIFCFMVLYYLRNRTVLPKGK